MNSENAIWKIWLSILLFKKIYTSQSQDTQLLLAPACQKIFERPKYAEQVCRAQNRYVLNNDVRWTRDRSQEPTPPSAHSPPKTPSPLFSPHPPPQWNPFEVQEPGKGSEGSHFMLYFPPTAKIWGRFFGGSVGTSELGAFLASILATLLCQLCP